jgi:light-regulated signal transduction histidine kinase (bacteriophytochrome)
MPVSSQASPRSLPQPEILNANDLVAEAWRKACPESERERIQFKSESLPEIYGDRIRLLLVFETLLSNALRFSVPDRQLTVEVGCTAFREKGVFFVRDNGEGFHIDHAERLFGSRTRLRTPAQSSKTDQGLALARHIVQEHGGRMWAEASVGHGATFYFTLPRKSLP